MFKPMILIRSSASPDIRFRFRKPELPVIFRDPVPVPVAGFKFQFRPGSGSGQAKNPAKPDKFLYWIK